ncbi:MAG: Y-family DNA polymerase [Chlorobi bacterium]|nr:Y-family DNA polymerase [Chlorobiota bacterium]
MGHIFFQKKDWLKEQGVAVLSSNYPLYADMSDRMVQVVRQIVDNITVYSVDEVFIDLNNCSKDLSETAFEIKNKLLKYLGLPVSVGIAPTKTLAKVAAFYAKRYPKFQNILILDNDKKIQDALKLIDVGEIWGVGRQFKKFLKANNIKSASDLRNTNEQFVKKHMTVTGLRTVKELKGISCISTDSISEERKNIIHTRTFKHTIKTKADLKAVISTFTVRLCEKLRFQHSAANMIGVFIETSRFKNPEYHYYNSKTVDLPVPSNDTFELIKYALNLLDTIFVSGYKYKRAGVMLFGLQDAKHLQYSLFDTINRPKHKHVFKAIDLLNASYGRDAVKYAVQGNDTKISVQERLSPQYTTSWKQIITVKADENLSLVSS